MLHMLFGKKISLPYTSFEFIIVILQFSVCFNPDYPDLK